MITFSQSSFFPNHFTTPSKRFSYEVCQWYASEVRVQLRLPLRCLFLFISLLTCQGAAISYTVQVAALSDEDAALALQQSLQQEGYPAYLVSVPSESGTIFRLRVGAFADRAAAQTYAEAMRGVGGTAPVPALAEGIPAELFPLEPTLLERYESAPEMTSVAVMPWGEGAALRTQGRFEDQPFIAEYRVLREGADTRTFEAWRAAPQPGRAGAALRTYNLSLWPGEETSETEREAYTEARLEEIARALELAPEQVRPFLLFEPGRGAPFLVLAEQFTLTEANPDSVSTSAVSGGAFDSASESSALDAVTGGSDASSNRSSRERYRALGNPAERMPPGGPSLTWFNRAPPAGFPTDLPTPLFDLQTLFPEGELEREDRTLTGDGWSASSQGDYTQLSVGDRTWRAVVGYPLWAEGAYLLVYADAPVLYKLVRPGQAAQGTGQ